MSQKESFEESPLKTIWSVANTIFGAIGLISFADDWVVWKSVFPEIISTYQSISRFPFVFFDIKIHQLWADYFFFGSLSGSAFVKAIGYGEKFNLVNNHGNPKSVRIFYFLLHLIFWPLGVLIALKQVLFGFDNPKEIKIKKNYLEWVLSILFLFLLILIWNNTI